MERKTGEGRSSERGNRAGSNSSVYRPRDKPKREGVPSVAELAPFSKSIRVTTELPKRQEKHGWCEACRRKPGGPPNQNEKGKDIDVKSYDFGKSRRLQGADLSLKYSHWNGLNLFHLEGGKNQPMMYVERGVFFCEGPCRSMVRTLTLVYVEATHFLKEAIGLSVEICDVTDSTRPVAHLAQGKQVMILYFRAMLPRINFRPKGERHAR